MPRPDGRSPISARVVVVDAGGDEPLQPAAARVEDAERRVARIRECGRGLDELLEQGVERQLGAERDPGLDERPRALLHRLHAAHYRAVGGALADYYGSSRARSSAGRRILAPSSASGGTSSWHDAQDDLGVVAERADDPVPFQQRLAARAGMDGEVALGVALVAERVVRGCDRVGHRKRSSASGITSSSALPLPATSRPRITATGTRSSLPITSCAAPAISSAIAITVAWSS